MDVILLDTSGLFCLFHAAELQQHQAVDFFDSAEIKMTTNYILAKFVALADARRLSRQLTLEFVNALQDSPEVTVIYVHDILHRAQSIYFSNVWTNDGHCVMQ